MFDSSQLKLLLGGIREVFDKVMGPPAFGSGFVHPGGGNFFAAANAPTTIQLGFSLSL